MTIHRDERGDGQADQRGELDEDVHRRAGGILERITDRIADDGGLMRLGLFVEGLHLAVDLDLHTLLKGLLGVVPGSAGVVLEDGP